MAAKTQFQAYMPLTGRRYGSFAGRTVFIPPSDDDTVSFIAAAPEHMQRHHFPRSSSHVGARHHHAFSLFPWFQPIGA